MDRYLKWFERVVVIVLIVMMSLVILLSTVELGWIIILDMITPPIILPQINELLEIFGFFLLILIGIELLETLRAYLLEHVVHVEVVLEVALIAIARKVIILEPKRDAQSNGSCHCSTYPRLGSRLLAGAKKSPSGPRCWCCRSDRGVGKETMTAQDAWPRGLAGIAEELDMGRVQRREVPS